MTDVTPEPVAPPSRWAPFLPSLLAAAGVLAWMVGTAVLFEVVRAFPSLTGMPTGFPGSLGRLFDLSTLALVALAAGVLFSFWLVAPIVARLTAKQVLLRSLVAAVVAVVVMFPVEFIVVAQFFSQLASQQTGAPGLIDVSPRYTPVQAATYAMAEVVVSAIARLPLIVLAALASWAWQRRSTAHAEA